MSIKKQMEIETAVQVAVDFDPQTLPNIIMGFLEARKKYAKDYLQTGHPLCLEGVVICNKEISTLLGITFSGYE